MQRGELDGAVDVFEEAVRRQPASAELRYNLGLALKQRDDFAASEEQLRRAMELDRTLADPPFTLGVVLWQTGRAAEAMPLFREAIKRRADYVEAHYMLGTILRQQGSTKEAIAEFRTTIALNPSFAEGHLNLGQALAILGDSDGARAALAEAERLNALKANAQASTFAVGVGVEKLKAGDIAGAIRQFRDATRLAPDNPRAHYQLALALRRFGAVQEAREHFAEAHRLAPYLVPPAEEKR
jgi:tetratricopeptide (TPR) repeat protein